MKGSFSQLKSQVPESRAHVIKLTGAGASAMTVTSGTTLGLSITYVGAGDHKLVWSESPGNFVSAVTQLQAATPSGLKNFSVILKDYDATNKTLEVFIFNGSGTATDLSTAQSLNLTVTFKETSLSA